MANEATRGAKFYGSFTYQLDDKGRVSLPAAFRKEAPDQRFVLIQVHPPALSLYPESSWVEVEERLQELRRRQPESRMWVLSLVSQAVEVVPDAQGRILIPSRLQEAAGLEGPVLVLGAIDRIELWNPQRFEDALAGNGEAFTQFAAQIFG